MSEGFEPFIKGLYDAAPKCKECGEMREYWDDELCVKCRKKKEAEGMTNKNESTGLPTETGSCFRCGSPKGKLKTIWDDVYYVCRRCEREAEEYAEQVANLYLKGESDCFIGFRAKDIPELKRLFAQSESEDIRKMVGFLEDVEADIWPKEEKE